MRKACKKNPIACGFNPADDAYEPLKLMQAVIFKTNEICQRYLDNSMLCSLPSPGAPHNLISSCAVRNSRRRMEDRHVVVHDLNTVFNDQEASPSSYYAIFDGHAGHDAAAYSAAHLHQYLAESKYFACNPEQALIDAFCKTDALFIEKCKVENFSSGTTAVCALHRPKEKSLYIAWAGDSQALLANQGKILQCVNPHKPGRPDEKQRIEQQGGTIIFWGTWRVNGQLAVSRAIGDSEYKPFVIAVPDVREIPLSGTEDFLILACDGLWDYLSEEDAATVVYKMVYDNPDNIDSISQRLVQLSKEQGSTDNISVIVVFLREPSKIAAEAQWAARTARTSAADMEAGLDNAANSFSNGSEIHVQKDAGFLLSLDGYKPASNGEDYFMERSTNGKSGGEFDENDDMGPETDVDALEEVAAPIVGKKNPFDLSEKVSMELELNSAQDLSSVVDKHFSDLHSPDSDVEDKDVVSNKEAAINTPDNERSDLMDSINAQIKQSLKDEDEKEEARKLDGDKDAFTVDEMDMYFQNHAENAVREETPTPPADEAQDGGLVADSGEDSEDEWNYIKGSSDKENIDPTQPDQEVADLTRERTQEEIDNMSQLNPDAAEFVPISPTHSVDSPACRALKNDTVLAQSPRRVPQDIDINVPEEQDFDREIKNCPSEFISNGHENGHKMSSQEIMENLLNGKNIDEIEFQPTNTPTKAGAVEEMFHFGPNATPFSTPGKFLDQSEALSTKANFGDETGVSLLNTDDGSFSTPNTNPFSDQSPDKTDFQHLNKESDPMSMSFYGDNEDTNPFDLNKVQVLPLDVDEFIANKPESSLNDTISDLPEHDPLENQVVTTDLDKRDDDLLGVCELAKSPLPEAKTPEPTLNENLCALNPVNDRFDAVESSSVKSSVSEPLEDFTAESPEPISAKSPIESAGNDVCLIPTPTEEVAVTPDLPVESAKTPNPPSPELESQDLLGGGDGLYSCQIRDQKMRSPIEIPANLPISPQFWPSPSSNDMPSPTSVEMPSPVIEVPSKPHEEIEGPKDEPNFEELEKAASPNQVKPLVCSLPPFCYPDNVFVDNSIPEPDASLLECPRPSDEPISPHEDITSSVKDEALSPIDDAIEDINKDLNYAQEMSSAVQENVAAEISSPIETKSPELELEIPSEPAAYTREEKADDFKFDVEIKEEYNLVPQTQTVENAIPEPIREEPKEIESSIIPEVAVAAAGVAVVAAIAAAEEKSPAKKPSAKTPTTKTSAKTTTLKTAKSSPMKASTLKASPISKTASAKSTSSAAAASKTAPAQPKPITKPKTTTPSTLTAKTVTEKKPLTNGDSKPATKSAPITKKSATAPVSSTRSAPTRPIAAKSIGDKPPTRPITAPAKAPVPRTTAAPRTTTTKTTASTLRPTTAPKSSTTSTTTTATKPKTAPATLKPRVPLSSRTAAPKTLDAEKQNKENVNKLMASRSSATAKTTTTTGTKTTTTARKIEPKTTGSKTAISRTTTVKSTTITTTKKPASELAGSRTGVTKTAVTRKVAASDVSKNGPTKITKTTTTKILKPQENGVTNGITTEVTTTAEITANELEPQLLKDLSPIEILDNSQLSEIIAD